MQCWTTCDSRRSRVYLWFSSWFSFVFTLGLLWVPSWFSLVPFWFSLGPVLALSWFSVGSLLDLSWFPLGSFLISSWLILSSFYFPLSVFLFACSLSSLSSSSFPSSISSSDNFIAGNAISNSNSDFRKKQARDYQATTARKTRGRPPSRRFALVFLSFP